MKIDREKIQKMCALPDDELWREIVNLGRAHGFSLPETTPSHEDMEKIRATAESPKLNAFTALRLLDSFRKGSK